MKLNRSELRQIIPDRDRDSETPADDDRVHDRYRDE
jgi:hypothetical protein